MKFTLQATPQVEAALSVAARWYDEHSDVVAARFEEAVRAVRLQLISTPLLWREFEAGYRRVHVQGFPYMLIYVVDGEVVTVVGVQPMRRHPDAWRGDSDDET
jgi:hypothetical protein